MKLKQLTYFLEVVKHKSFTNASRELYICQSALSKTIKSLETELKVQLIDRTSKSFRLTAEGRCLYEHGKRALKNINDEFDSLYDAMKLKRGKITVGVPPVIGTIYFTTLIQKFRQMYPDIELTILEEGANMVKDKVEEAEIDIGVVILPFSSENFNITKVFASDNVLIVHKSHRLANLTEVGFKELQKERFISLNKTFMLNDRIKQLCYSAGFTPNIGCESSQWDFVAEMVALNQGVAILPRPILSRFYSKEIRIISLKEPEFPWDIALIVKKDKYVSNPIKLFIDFVQSEGNVSDDPKE